MIRVHKNDMRQIKQDILDEFGTSWSTVVRIGEGLSRRDVK